MTIHIRPAGYAALVGLALLFVKIALVAGHALLSLPPVPLVDGLTVLVALAFAVAVFLWIEATA